MRIVSSLVTVALAACICGAPFQTALASPETPPNTYRTEELKLQLGRFSVVGDLILPDARGKHPVLIVVPGDGPFTRAQGLRFLKVIGLFDYLMSEGYGIFLDDKPGSGASRGEFSTDSLLHQRAAILSRWVEQLKEHPAVDDEHIGFFGVSQAGYVMPLALAESPGIAFMIAVSCPGEDSVSQFVYLVEQQMRCEGYPEAEVGEVSRALMTRETARNYHDYRDAAVKVAANPVARDQAGGDIVSEESFTPVNLEAEDFFDPTGILGRTTMPILALFGAKDTLVDPIQGSEAYSKALKAAGNPESQVKVIQGVDHILSFANTGSEKELMEKLRTHSVVYTPEYLASIIQWLTKLKAGWDS